jgi:hypothetical protein
MVVPAVTQKDVEMFPAAMDAGMTTMSESKKIMITVAAHKADKESLAAVEAGKTPRRTNEKIMISMVARKAINVPQEAATAGVTRGRADKKKAASMANQKAGRMPLMVVEAGAPPVEVCKKLVPPLVVIWNPGGVKLVPSADVATHGA